MRDSLRRLFRRIQDKGTAVDFRLGDEAAFARLFGQYREPILSYVSARVSDPEDAQELVQEIFLKAYRFRESYDPCFAFSTWIWTIARNTALDWNRKARPTEEAAPASPEDLFSPPAADALIDRQFNRLMIRRVLRRLTTLQRRAIWLRAIHQLSYDEISRRLGLTPSAVKSLIHRARLSLREHDARLAPG